MTESVNELNADLFGEGPGDDDQGLDPKAARRKAMDFLARREYGREELIGRLKAGGFDPDVAAAEVARLAAEGLQDDIRFAANFASSKLGRGTGPLRIRQALIEKGLSESAADDALDGLDADWEQQAREVRLKKFGESIPTDFKEKARQMRFLQYRGFDHDQIRAAMRHDE
jgi:regulatory protein